MRIWKLTSIHQEQRFEGTNSDRPIKGRQIQVTRYKACLGRSMFRFECCSFNPCISLFPVDSRFRSLVHKRLHSGTICRLCVLPLYNLHTYMCIYIYIIIYIYIHTGTAARHLRLCDSPASHLLSVHPHFTLECLAYEFSNFVGCLQWFKEALNYIAVQVQELANGHKQL